MPIFFAIYCRFHTKNCLGIFFWNSDWSKGFLTLKLKRFLKKYRFFKIYHKRLKIHMGENAEETKSKEHSPFLESTPPPQKGAFGVRFYFLSE